jgi:membrane protein required for beta-lactamase induction
MRPSDIYFCLVPPPAGIGALLAQRDWLTVLAVAVSLTLLGVAIRVLNAWLDEVKEKGGWRNWRTEGYAVVETRERTRTASLRAEEERSMIKLEGKQRRREYRRRSPSWRDQESLFR